jgi:uncharacterized protein DUF3891
VIVSRESGGLCVVLQVDHQDQCRLAARAWGNGRFARLDPWGPVEVAAAVHDEGWRAWEAMPRVDADGHPMDFPKLARREHIRLYEDGIAASERHGAAVGLLVSMHGLGLYRSRLGLDGPAGDLATLPPVAQGFVRDQLARQERLWAQLGDDPGRREWAWAAYRLIQAWDGLSLYLTWRGLPQGRPGRLSAVPRDLTDPGVDLDIRPVDSRTAVCDPFPFAGGEAIIPVVARIIPDRYYNDDADLRSSLNATRPERRDFRILAPGG